MTLNSSTGAADIFKFLAPFSYLVAEVVGESEWFCIKVVPVATFMQKDENTVHQEFPESFNCTKVQGTLLLLK